MNAFSCHDLFLSKVPLLIPFLVVSFSDIQCHALHNRSSAIHSRRSLRFACESTRSSTPPHLNLVFLHAAVHSLPRSFLYTYPHGSQCDFSNVSVSVSATIPYPLPPNSRVNDISSISLRCRWEACQVLNQQGTWKYSDADGSWAMANKVLSARVKLL